MASRVSGAPASQRRRMYVFERAYVDYATRIRGYLAGLFRGCGAIWEWFWDGPGALGIEWILRALVVATAIALATSYVRYEIAHGRGFSLTMAGVVLVIAVFAVLLLWGWKAVVHFVARVASGAAAAGVVLVLALAALVVATALFSVYLLLLCLLTALSFLVFLPLRIAQEAWLLYRRIGYNCPWGDCPNKGLPIHVCTCGRQYHDLLPGFYGILHHTCRHDDGTEVKLATLDMLGRNKLPRLCAGCQRPLGATGLAEHPIALVGGPSAGKTVLLVQTVRALKEHFAKLRGTVTLPSSEQADQFESLSRELASGRVLAKTGGGIAQAWAVAVKVPKGPGSPKRIRSLLHLFDNPGEVFESVQRFGQMHALQHVKGILLLVDPFALPSLVSEGERLGAEVGASKTTLQDLAENLVFAAKNQGLPCGDDGKCTVPVGVVLTKADALPADGRPYLTGLLPGPGAEDGQGPRCRLAIEKLGGAPSLRALEMRFSNVRYFACSALGRMPGSGDSRAFAPAGVVEPFLWLMGGPVSQAARSAHSAS